jgi:HAD superfamily hydrolase (TIGR01509 family)
MISSFPASAPPMPRAGALRLVIFDCDGVLFDSWRANVAFYDTVLASIGLPPLDDAGRRLCHTLASSQLYARLFPEDPAIQRRLGDAARATDYGPFYGLMEPVPGLDATLRRLAAHCALALATNRGITVRGVVERFGLDAYLSTYVGVLDVRRPKPAPDLLVACLERSGVPACSAVYVGDTESDAAAAREAGVAYIGVGDASGAAVRIGSIRELPAMLLE